MADVLEVLAALVAVVFTDVLEVLEDLAAELVGTTTVGLTDP